MTPDLTNLYNQAETACVNTIQNDAWLGDADHVAKVHEKLRINNDWSYKYLAHQTPAIGCYCPGSVGGQEPAGGGRTLRLRMVFNIVVYGGDVNAADEKCKEIGARLQHLISIQRLTARYPEAATLLDGFIAQGEIALDDQMIFSVSAGAKKGWIAEGATAATISLYLD